MTLLVVLEKLSAARTTFTPESVATRVRSGLPDMGGLVTGRAQTMTMTKRGCM